MKKKSEQDVDVLLISPHIAGCEYTISMSTAVPLGLIRIGASLRRKGIRAAVLNLTPLQRPETIDALLEQSLKTVVNQGIAGVSMNISLLRGGAYYAVEAVRRNRPDISIGVGGIHATHLSKSLLDALKLDFVALGEAEESLPEFITSRGVCVDTPGILEKRHSTRPENARIRFVRDLDSLPFPDYGLTNLRIQKELYTRRPDMYDSGNLTLEDGLMVEASRGCPGHCVFCAVASRPYRRHSPEYVVNVIRELNAQHGFNSFSFIDDFFTQNRLHTLELCQALSELNFPVIWAAQTRADFMDRDLAKAMKSAGCRLIAFGIESGSTKIQSSLKKKLSLDKARATMNLVREHGIKTQTFFLVGHPGESAEDIEQSEEFISLAAPDQFCIDILKVFPGTELYANMKSAGDIDDDYWLDWKNPMPVAAMHKGNLNELEQRKKRLEYVWYQTRNKQLSKKMAVLLGPEFRTHGNPAGDVHVRNIFQGRPGHIHLQLKKGRATVPVLLEYFFDRQGKLDIRALADPFVKYSRPAAAEETARFLNSHVFADFGNGSSSDSP